MNPPAPQTLALVAGYRPDGEAIMERLSVDAVTDAKSTDEYRLLKSPGFLRGLAAGDRIRYPARNEAGYELLKRSGNLSIRVMRRDDLDAVAQVLSPELELLDGSLDQLGNGSLLPTTSVDQLGATLARWMGLSAADALDDDDDDDDDERGGAVAAVSI
jgi:hypothetical protein